MHAIVIFHDKGAGFWPWLFGRPGFRHCLVAVNDDRAWMVIDPRSNTVDIRAEVDADYDLAAFYRLQGFTVVEAQTAGARRRYPVWFFTCVEAVKRILGLQGWWIWTPYQLYKHLEKRNGK